MLPALTALALAGSTGSVWRAGPLAEQARSATPDDVVASVSALTDNGLAPVAVATDDPVTASRVEQLGGVQLMRLAGATSDGQLLRWAESVGASCVVLAETSPPALAARLVGDCAGTRVPLSEAARARLARVALDHVQVRPPSPLAGTPAHALLAESAAGRRGLRRVGTGLMWGGAAVAGGTLIWYGARKGRSIPDGEWDAMRATNGVGVGVLLGGGTAVALSYALR